MRLFEITAAADEHGADGGAWEGDLPGVGEGGAWFQGLAAHAGAEFKDLALGFAADAGATVLRRGLLIGHYPVDALIEGGGGARFVVLCHGTPDDGERAGLRRTDTVLKMGFRAMQLARRQHLPVLVLTSHLPDPRSRAGRYLADLAQDVFDVVAVTGDFRGFRRLQTVLADGAPVPPDAPWRRPPTPETALFDTDAGGMGEVGLDA